MNGMYVSAHMLSQYLLWYLALTREDSARPSHHRYLGYPAEAKQNRSQQEVLVLVSYRRLRKTNKGSGWNVPHTHDGEVQSKWQDYSHPYEIQLIHTYTSDPFKQLREAGVCSLLNAHNNSRTKRRPASL